MSSENSKSVSDGRPERRAHPRKTLRHPVNAELGSVDARIINVGDGGVMLVVSVPVEIGIIQRLSRAQDPDSFAVWVRIVNSLPVTSQARTRYLVNVEFVSALQSREREIIRRWHAE
jgi:hypothetical protein